MAEALKSPLISIIVPVYNAASFLRRCIDSLLAQSFTDYELVLIDDGSTDGSTDICHDYLLKDSRVKVFCQANKGVSTARNKGIEVAIGQYLSFVDADDWVDPDFLAVFAEEIEKRGGMVDCIIQGFVEREKGIKQASYNFYSSAKEIGANLYNLEEKWLVSYVWNKLFRKEVIKSWNISYDTQIPIGEDFLFCMTFIGRCTSMSVLPYVGYHYVFPSSSKKQFSFAAWNRRLDSFDKLLPTMVYIPKLDVECLRAREFKMALYVLRIAYSEQIAFTDRMAYLRKIRSWGKGNHAVRLREYEKLPAVRCFGLICSVEMERFLFESSAPSSPRLKKHTNYKMTKAGVNEMKISVVIPMYNVGPYVERCVRTMMEQGMQDVEYIFVDDCSTDDSYSIAKKVVSEYTYPAEQIIFLQHDVNRGLPSARNTGLQHATGDYIFHCDSDDYLAPNALQRLCDEAYRTDADIVYSDWYLTFPKRQRYMPTPEYGSPLEALKGLLHGTMKYNVWNKLVRRSLYTDNHISFLEGHSMGEDMTMIMLFACAGKVAHLPLGTYHYVRQNENAFTAQRTEQSYEDLRMNALRVISYLEGKVAEEDIACFKLSVKFPFLISGSTSSYQRWNEWFPEANSYISKQSISFRARLLQKAALRKQYWLLKLYYYLFHKVVYGIVYRENI